MPIDVVCPTCGNQGRFPDEWFGRVIECPTCKTPVQLAAEPNATFTPPMVTADAADATFVVAAPFSATPTPPSTGGIDTIVPLVPAVDATHNFTTDDPIERRWLGAESERFRAYVDDQLALLRQQRHDLVNYQSQTEGHILARVHEVAQREATLATRDDAIREREAAAGRHEAELARDRAELANRERELREFRDVRAAAATELANLRGELDRTRAETEEARTSARAARQELDTLLERRQQLKEMHAAAAERSAQLDKREADINQQDQALKTRIGEMDEMEDQIQRELEERRRDLDNWQRLLEERELHLTPRPTTTRPRASGLLE